MKKCVSCGLDIEEGVRFCMHCGAPQPADAAPAAPAAPTVTETPVIPTVMETPAAPVTPAAPAEEAKAETPEAKPAVQPTLEQKEPVHAASAAPRTETVHFSAPQTPAQPAHAQQPVHPQQTAQPQRPVFTPTPVPAVDPERPAAKSRWALMGTWGTVGAMLLMSIPVVGLIFAIVWACGGCRKYAKRNLARAELILMAVGVLLAVAGALVLRFVFPEYLIGLYEILHPGYTIVF